MRYPFGGICVGQCGADLHNDMRKWGKSCPLIGQWALNLNSYTVRWLKTWLSLNNLGLLHEREFKLLRKRWSDIVSIYRYIESGSGSGGVESKLLHGSMVENMVIFTALHSTPVRSTPLQFLGLLYKREFKLLRKRWSVIVTIYWYTESGSGSRFGFSLKVVICLFVCFLMIGLITNDMYGWTQHQVWVRVWCRVLFKGCDFIYLFICFCFCFFPCFCLFFVFSYWPYNKSYVWKCTVFGIIIG